MKTRIVVPCYDEAARLRAGVFEAFASRHPDLGLLFVNDGSRDETGPLLRRLCEGSPQLVLLDLPRNAGKAEAVRRGIQAALAQAPRYVGYWDADLSTPLEAVDEFEALLDARPELELVLGARVKLLGRSIERSSLRHYAGRVFATAASRVLGLPVYDTQCGAKLFRVSPATTSLFAEPFLTRWTFDVEILARLVAQRRGGQQPAPAQVLYELPLRVWIDVAGSKVKPWDLPRSLWELLRIRRHYLR